MATEKNKLELYFEWYINELKEEGYIKSIRREPFSIEVLPPQLYKRYNFTKANPVVEDYKLFYDITYTKDYVIEWFPHAKELFFNVLDGSPIRIACPFYAIVDKTGGYFSFCDVKPTSAQAVYGNNVSGYTFPFIQKMIYATTGIYINKCIPIPLVRDGEIKSGNKNSLFPTTFVPKRYHLTDGGMQGRDIKYQKRSLREFVAWKTKEIDKINARFNSQLSLM